MKISVKISCVIALIPLIIILTMVGGMGQQQKNMDVESARKDRLENREGGVEQRISEGAEGLEYPRLESAVDPDRYVLGPYDQLVLNLLGTRQRSYDIVVLPEGAVFLPGMGEIQAAGLTLTQFRKRLSSRIDIYFHNIEYFCYLKIPRKFRVFVTGEVEEPGAVSVSAIQRVSDAIEKAGGISGKGVSCNVILTREGDSSRVDLRRFRLKGDFHNNPFLRIGDRIHVPPGGWRVIIRGEVKREGDYCILPGETIGDLIELAGGFTDQAVTDSVMLSRVGKSGPVASVDVAARNYDRELRNLDEVSVYDRLRGSARVYLMGEEIKPRSYYIMEGERLDRFVIRIGRFNDLSNLEAATLTRRDGRAERIDIKGILSGERRYDIPMKNGDVLNISRIYDSVLVGGEVQEPGKFNYMGELTVAGYIGMAGGPTERGSVDRVDVYPPGGEKISVGRDYRPKRGDVVIVKRSRLNILGRVLDGAIRLGTVVVSIIVLTN